MAFVWKSCHLSVWCLCCYCETKKLAAKTLPCPPFQSPVSRLSQMLHLENGHGCPYHFFFKILSVISINLEHASLIIIINNWSVSQISKLAESQRAPLAVIQSVDTAIQSHWIRRLVQLSFLLLFFFLLLFIFSTLQFFSFLYSL